MDTPSEAERSKRAGELPHGLGFQGAVGLRFRLGTGASLFAELGGRYARPTGFEGTYSYSNSVNNVNYNRSGRLYAYTYTIRRTGESRLVVGMAQAAPTSSSTVERTDVRDAAVDFSGAAVRAGVQISF